MDDKELVVRIRNSFKVKRSRAEIINIMINKGYKLEYIEALIKKAKSPRKIIIISIITSVVLISLLIAFFAIFDQSPTSIGGSGVAINNPLDGLKILFNAKPGEIENPINSSPFSENQNESEIYLEDITITPEFIAYLLQEIGALESLHKNVITREIPIINFKIEDTEYNAAFKETLEISTGLSQKADIQFNSNKEAIVKAILDEDPASVFKSSIAEGTTTIEKIAGETELFAKGYLTLYNSLK